MAVSFKVPASPKRSIFNIDTFLGVDMTNTGANVDEVRSPNAENMIRYVPGKVRKRMGYSVPVQFSKGEDVNRAVNSSDEYIACEWDENGKATFNIYDDHIDKVYIYLDVKAVGSYSIQVVAKNNAYIHGEFSGTIDEPYENRRLNFGYDMSSDGGFSHITIVHLSNDPDDYCQVANLRLCHATVADAREKWIELPWKPAPEDNGNAFILTPQNSAIYGKHTLKTNKKQGDFVTNVNRALGTTNTYATFWDKVVCILGETIPMGKTFHLKFDYEDANNTTVYMGRSGSNPQTIDTIDGSGTFEADVTATIDFIYITLSDTTTKIKGLILSYAATDDIVWKEAPEDQGAEFDIDSVYQKTGYNTAIFTSNAENQLFPNVTNWMSPEMAVQQSTTAVTGKLTIIDFDVSMTAYKALGGGGIAPVNIVKYIVKAASSDNVTSYFNWVDGAPSNAHFRLYLHPNANAFIEKLTFDVQIDETINTTGQVTISISNITVYEGVEKTDFWSAAYINLYHVGSRMYANKSGQNTYNLIYSDMNQQRSVSWQFEAHDQSSEALGYDNLYIVDGKTYLEYNGATETIAPVNGSGRIPLVTFAKEPSGGGTSYYPLNRLQPGFEEQFIGNGSDTNYQLSFGNLDTSPVRVWVMDQNDGAWIEQAEVTDFSVNYGLGLIQFTNPPWDATQVGEDNVRIRAFRTIQRYANSINKCSFGTLFGVGGTSDRLFLSGNTDLPSYDFYSQDYDPTYFPDVNYATLGVSSSAIKGYARVNNYLATFKDENEPSQSVFIREGDLIVNSQTNMSEPAFKLINTLQGNGAISPYTFGYLQTEPLFLTKSGVYAITSQDITGEKYGQSRSFYLNGALLKEDNLANACAVVYNDQYILAINGHLYVLDGLQAVRTDPQEPYATRQYVGFYCTGIPANVMWTYEDALWFGTSDGKVCEFYTDSEDLESYNDDGEAIYCCWETPDLDGKLFYKNKTFRYFAVRMMKAIRTSVRIYAQKKGNWMPMIKEDRVSGLAFDFNNIDFTLFSFSTDRSEKVAHCKVRVKKVDKARFKVENGYVNEPFGLFDLALEYVESGNYKG